MKKILLVIASVLLSLAMVFTPAYADDDICSKVDHSIPNYDTLCGGKGETELQGNVKSVLNTVYFWVSLETFKKNWEAETTQNCLRIKYI